MTNDYENHMQFLCLKLLDHDKKQYSDSSVLFSEIYTHTLSKLANI